MQEQVIDVLTTVPAFLGAADQSAEWRTPAFKALLREWWRVRMARSYGYDHEKLREAEGAIFGHAALRVGRRTWACRSRVVITLDEWRPGRLESWTRDSSFPHPREKRPVQSQLYLGYGPLIFDKGRGTGLKSKPAIKDAEVNHLRIWCPEYLRATVDEILHLAHLFGAVGGRCRNGWGSIQLAREGALLPGFGSNEASKLLDTLRRPFRDCLELSFTHALGEDTSGRMLLWRTKQATRSWQETIKLLAEAKVAFRTRLELRSGEFSERHLLGLPVTKHPLPSVKQARLGSQLRFKVVLTRRGYLGIAFHLPCGMPASLRSGWSVDRQAAVWEKVHRVLDEKLVRIEKGDPELLGSERREDLPRPEAASARRDEPPKRGRFGRGPERRGDAHDARTPPVRRELTAEGLRNGQRIHVVVRAKTEGKPGWQAEHEGKRYPLHVSSAVEWQDGDRVEVVVNVTAMGKIEFRWAPAAGPRGGPPRRR